MRKVFLICVLILISAGPSLAVPIDFRTDLVIPDGSSSFYYADAGLTITADTNIIYRDGDTVYPWDAVIYQDETGGLGVDSLIAGYESSEIEANEYLYLHFDESQYITSMLIADLFVEQSNDSGDWYKEVGFYLFYDESTAVNSGWTAMTAVEYFEEGLNGEYLVAMDPTPVTDIWFRAPGLLNYSSDYGGYLEDHEFSVAMIDVQAVPEPSSLMLLGVGMAGLYFCRRRIGK